MPLLTLALRECGVGVGVWDLGFRVLGLGSTKSTCGGFFHQKVQQTKQHLSMGLSLVWGSDFLYFDLGFEVWSFWIRCWLGNNLRGLDTGRRVTPHV